MSDPSSRKRSRAPSPKPPAAPLRRNDSWELDKLRAAQLRDPTKRNEILNDLLRITSTHEKNYSLSSDSILKELAKIVVDDCISWEEPEQTSHSVGPPTFRSTKAWIDPPSVRAKAWANHWTMQLGTRRNFIDPEKLRTMEVILVIIRNLSFVGANLRLLVYSPGLLDLLVGCLYEGTDNYYGSEEPSTTSNTMLSFSAMHALVHLAPYMDVTGQKLLSDRLFYKPPATGSDEGPSVPETQSFGQAVGGNWGFGGLWLAKRLDAKEDAISDVSKEFVLSLTSDYLVSVWSMFPALANVLVNPRSPRSVILMAMDLLQELINQARVGVVGSVQLEDDEDSLPTIRAVLVNIPDEMLERLLDMLYVPRLGPDSLEYVDPVHNIVTRVTTLKLLMGYDATVDTDVRDRALDVLVPLMELDSPRMAARLGRDKSGSIRRRLFDAVVPILTTTAGRNEASMLASQLLRELSMAEENELGFLYIQERLVELASRDSRVSQLVWNHIFIKPNRGHETDTEASVHDDSQ